MFYENCTSFYKEIVVLHFHWFWLSEVQAQKSSLDLPRRPSKSYRLRSEIRTKWRFNRAKHFHQLKSLGLKKALHRFKGMRTAQAARLLPLALANYSPPSQDYNRLVWAKMTVGVIFLFYYIYRKMLPCCYQNLYQLLADLN